MHNSESRRLPLHPLRTGWLPPALKGRGAGGVRSVLICLLLAALACSRLNTALGTPLPASTAAHLGQFDCYGNEKGALAYAGRVTIQPGGVVTFKGYSGGVETGAWTYAAEGHAFTFSGSTPLASGVYRPAQDTLTVVFTPAAKVAHAEGGSLSCQRAEPGQTGPP